MISVTIRSPDLDLTPQWDDLVSRAQPNVFMSPAALKAACDTMFAMVHVLLAWDQSVEPHKLVGLWAVQERHLSLVWPAFLDALPFDYAFLSSPVIDPRVAHEVMPAFFAAIENHPSLPNVISVKSLDGESAAYAAMLSALKLRGNRKIDLGDSARPFASRETGVKRSGSTRKKLRQDWNRLSALGSVDIINERTPEAVTQAFEQFLGLEFRSWKGARHTALLSDDGDARFVRRLIGDLASGNNASVALLRVDGRAIAAQVLMYCGTMAYTWKTAFDAGYAKYSPGALLIDRVTEELFDTTTIEAIDSCAAEGSFMGQLWSGRRMMVDLLVDVGSSRSAAFTLEAGRQLGRERLKGLRDRLRAISWLRPFRKSRLATSPK